MDRAAFRVAFPEFNAHTGDSGDARIDAALAAATRQTDAEVFGVDTEEAIGVLAAHILASNPAGVQTRLQTGKNAFASFETVYRARRTELETLHAAQWV